jgi:hypothetical protein
LYGGTPTTVSTIASWVSSGAGTPIIDTNITIRLNTPEDANDSYFLYGVGAGYSSSETINGYSITGSAFTYQPLTAIIKGIKLVIYSYISSTFTLVETINVSPSDVSETYLLVPFIRNNAYSQKAQITIPFNYKTTYAYASGVTYYIYAQISEIDFYNYSGVRPYVYRNGSPANLLYDPSYNSLGLSSMLNLTVVSSTTVMELKV